MDQPTYSAFADLLSKFHTASEPIQALALILAATVALGATWSLTRILTAALTRTRHPTPPGNVLGVVYEGPDGRPLVMLHGRALRAWRDGEARGELAVGWREVDAVQANVKSACPPTVG